jgi:hypothetical protein
MRFHAPSLASTAFWPSSATQSAWRRFLATVPSYGTTLTLPILRPLVPRSPSLLPTTSRSVAARETMLAPSVSSLLAAAEVTTVLALTTGRVTSTVATRLPLPSRTRSRSSVTCAPTSAAPSAIVTMTAASDLRIEFGHWNQLHTVNVDNIEAGTNVRSTIMLRNSFDRVDFEDLKLFLDATSEGHYDFFYLRIDFSNNLKVDDDISSQSRTPRTTYLQNNYTCVFVSTFPFSKPPLSHDQVPNCCLQDTASRVRAHQLPPSARGQGVQHPRLPQEHVDQEATTRRATASARRQDLQDVAASQFLDKTAMSFSCSQEFSTQAN